MMFDFAVTTASAKKKKKRVDVQKYFKKEIKTTRNWSSFTGKNIAIHINFHDYTDSK